MLSGFNIFSIGGDTQAEKEDILHGYRSEVPGLPSAKIFFKHGCLNSVAFDSSLFFMAALIISEAATIHF